MSWRVLKFGGTSVGSAEALVTAVARVAQAAREGPAVAVVSAFAGVTDAIAQALALAAARDPRYRALLPELRARSAHLLGAVAPYPRRSARHCDEAGLSARQCSDWNTDARQRDDPDTGAQPRADPHLSARLRAEAQCSAALARLGELLDAAALLRRVPEEVRDETLAFGERLAAPIFTAGLAAAGCESELVDAGELLRTDACFGEGNVDLVASAAAATRRLAGVHCVVVPGFFGADAAGRTVLLGRGGSDTTATVLGAVLRAERVEIWTDVDGVLTADPRRVPEARTLPFLTYDDAGDAAALGAKVLHARALAPAAAAGVPIVVRNSFAADGGETWIGCTARTDSPKEDSAPTFVVTTAPNLALWRSLRSPQSAGRALEEGDAVLAAVGPAVAGRAAELARALDDAGVAITGLAGGIAHPAFVAIVPAAAVEHGLATLHRQLAGHTASEPRRISGDLPRVAAR